MYLHENLWSIIVIIYKLFQVGLLKKIGGTNKGHAIKNILSRTIGPNVAVFYSWGSSRQMENLINNFPIFFKALSGT